VRILVVQLWTEDLNPIEVAAREAGIDAAFTRADFEAAINAVLAHEHFDLAIFDPTTPDLTREIVENCFRLHGRDIPLIVLEPGSLSANISRVLNPRRN
jgi:hypothetical protein